MVQEKPGKAPRISFVDLEDFRSLRTVSWRRRLLNLVHLDRSIGRFLNRPARLRCLYEYLDTGKMAHNERRDMVRQVWELREDLETRRRMRAVAKSERQAVAAPAEKLASVAAAAPDGFVPPPAR